MGIVQLLQAIRNLTKIGSIKSIEQAYKLAQREVGERFNQVKKQIDDAFNQGKKEQTLDKRTKDIKKIDQEGIKSIETEQSDLMKRLEDKVKNLTNVENISTGLTRTIAREILSRRGIDIPKGRDAIELFREKFGQDVLIDVNNLAEELVEMDRIGKKPKSLTQIIEQEGFFDVKMPKEPPQGYTPDELAEIQKEIEQEDILLKFDPTGRKSNSMGGRVGLAIGGLPKGIISLIKLINKKFGKGTVKTADKAPIPPKTLERDMFKAADNRINKKEGVFMEDGKTPDYDYYKEILDDAEDSMGFNVAGDETIEELLKREKTLKDYEADMYDQYITGKLDPEPGSKSQARLNLLKKRKEEAELTDDYRLFNSDDADELDELEEFLDQDYKRVKAEQADLEYEKNLKGLEDLGASKLAERFKLKKKYPGITDDLLDKILIDDNMQRKAEVLATLDEAFKMMEKGMGPDEVLSTIKNVTRTKQAMGTGPEGLSQITELFEKIKVKNENKRAEKKSDQQIRYRKLIESNKFPELNKFFQAKLNESNGDMNLEVRMNAQTGGPFTKDFLDQRKKQSQLDFIARQGVPRSTSTRTGYTGPGFSNSSPATGGTTGGSSGTGTGTSGTSGTSGGTGGTSGGSGVIPGYTNYQPNTDVTGGGNTGGSGGGSGRIGIGNTGGGGGTMTIDKGTEETINITPPSSGGGGSSSSGGGTGSTGSAPSYQSRLDEYKAFVERNKNDPRAILSPNSFFTGQELMDNPELQDAAYKDVYNPGREFQKQVQAGYNMPKGYTGDDPRGTTDSYQYEEDMDASTSPGVTDPNRTETLLEKRKREEAEAAAKKEAEEAAKKEQEEGGGADYFPETANISQITDSAKNVDLFNSGQYENFMRVNENKTVAKDSRGFDIKWGDVAKFVGKNVLLPYLTGGGSVGLSTILKTTATNMAKDYAKDKTTEFVKDKLNLDEDNKLPEMAISFLSEGGRVNKAIGGSIDLEARKKQSYEDFLARQPGAQSQAPTAQPAQPVAPQPTQPATSQPSFMTSGSATPTTSTTTAPQPQPTRPGPFDMSKYQGGTFTGGIEDSRNIALNELADLGVDIDKYRSVSAKKDSTAPTFQGYTNNELMMMSPEEFEQKLGFDPSVQGTNPEFEKFLEAEFNRTGPMPIIGMGGPAGGTTEFRNQDELAQILNRAIPFYMRNARELGENYTLEEMLAMSDDDFAMLDDRYNKKMGYGKYRKTPGNIYNTGSTDKSQAQETMEDYSSNIKPQGTGIGLGSQYATGGRVGFSSGSERKRIDKNMRTDYSNPFDNLAKINASKEKAFTNALFKRNKKLVADEKKRKKKNLTILNEDARKKALQRLNLLKRLYASGKR